MKINRQERAEDEVWSGVLGCGDGVLFLWGGFKACDPQWGEGSTRPSFFCPEDAPPPNPHPPSHLLLLTDTHTHADADAHAYSKLKAHTKKQHNNSW